MNLPRNLPMKNLPRNLPMKRTVNLSHPLGRKEKGMNLTRVKGQKKAKIGRDNPDDDGNGGSSGGSYAGGGSSAGGGDIVGESSSTGGENHKTSGDGSGTSSS
jgi:hypothetical protein